MRFIDLIIKDIKTVVYDVKSLAIILIMPIVLMSILGMSLQMVFGDETESGIAMATVGIVKNYDYDEELAKLEGRLSEDEMNQADFDAVNAERIFFEMMDSKDVKGVLDYKIVDLEEGQTLLRDETLDALVILPKGFIYNFGMSRKGRIESTIEYVVNPDNDFVAMMMSSIFSEFAGMTNLRYAQNVIAYGDVLKHRPELLDQLDSDGPNIIDMLIPSDKMSESIAVNLRSVHKEEVISSFQYYAAAIMCMFLLYSAGVGGRALLEERKEKKQYLG